MAESYQVIGNSTLLRTWCNNANPSELNPAPTAGMYASGLVSGEAVPRQTLNQLHKEEGEKINHVLQNGIPLWNATTAYLIGNFVGYNNTGWVCVANNTNSTPTTSNANWKQLATGRGIKAHCRASLLVTTAITTTATAVPFGVNDLLEGTISHSTSTNTTRFVVNEAGSYEFNFQPQISALSNTGDSCTFWLRKNGTTAIANSAIQVVNNNVGYTSVPNSAIIENLAVGDYIEFMCVASANSKYELEYTPASSPVPNIPACIVTVKGW